MELINPYSSIIYTMVFVGLIIALFMFAGYKYVTSGKVIDSQKLFWLRITFFTGFIIAMLIVLAYIGLIVTIKYGGF
jgi:small-conductance mechanosensitive channel